MYAPKEQRPENNGPQHKRHDEQIFSSPKFDYRHRFDHEVEEQEADAFADDFVNGKNPELPGPKAGIKEEVQPKLEDDADEEDTGSMVMAKGKGTGGAPPEGKAGAKYGYQGSIAQRLKEGRSVDRYIEDANRLEAKIRADQEAASMAESINARAFTKGDTIYFNSGEYQPETREGQWLIAHEMAHVAQGGEGIRRKEKYDDRDIQTVTDLGQSGDVWVRIFRTGPVFRVTLLFESSDFIVHLQYIPFFDETDPLRGKLYQVSTTVEHPDADNRMSWSPADELSMSGDPKDWVPKALRGTDNWARVDLTGNGEADISLRLEKTEAFFDGTRIYTIRKDFPDTRINDGGQISRIYHSAQFGFNGKHIYSVREDSDKAEGIMETATRLTEEQGKRKFKYDFRDGALGSVAARLWDEEDKFSGEIQSHSYAEEIIYIDAHTLSMIRKAQEDQEVFNPDLYFAFELFIRTSLLMRTMGMGSEGQSAEDTETLQATLFMIADILENFIEDQNPSPDSVGDAYNKITERDYVPEVARTQGVLQGLEVKLPAWLPDVLRVSAIRNDTESIFTLRDQVIDLMGYKAANAMLTREHLESLSVGKLHVPPQSASSPPSQLLDLYAANIKEKMTPEEQALVRENIRGFHANLSWKSDLVSHWKAEGKPELHTIEAWYYPDEQPADRSALPGNILSVPVPMYYFRKDDSWHLFTIFQEKTQAVEIAAKADETEPPIELFAELNKGKYFAKGKLAVRTPGNHSFEIWMTEPKSLADTLSDIGFYMFLAGLVGVTGGLAAPAVGAFAPLAFTGSVILTGAGAVIEVVNTLSSGESPDLLTFTLSLFDIAEAVLVGLESRLVANVGKLLGAGSGTVNKAYDAFRMTGKGIDVVGLLVGTADMIGTLYHVATAEGMTTLERIKAIAETLAFGVAMGYMTIRSLRADKAELSARAANRVSGKGDWKSCLPGRQLDAPDADGRSRYSEGTDQVERALHEKASRWEADPSHKTEAEQFRRESNKEVLGSEEPHRKKKQDEGEHDALNRKARILTEAKIITEIHDAIDTPVGVLLNLLQPLARGSSKVDYFYAKHKIDHHEVWMKGSDHKIKLTYTDGKATIDVPRRQDRDLHGGNQIEVFEGITTTITGVMLDVNTVNNLGGRKNRRNGLAVSGENPGGLNILRSPEWGRIQAKHRHVLEAGQEQEYWKLVTDEFWETVNKPWLLDAIERGDVIRFVSDPLDEYMTFVNHKGAFTLDENGNKIRSIFGREVDLLREHGYVFGENGIAYRLN